MSHLAAHALSAQLSGLLAALGGEIERIDCEVFPVSAYLVGGLVRDLMLVSVDSVRYSSLVSRWPLDIDVAIEGDSIAVVQELVRRSSIDQWRIAGKSVFKKYGTAKLRLVSDDGISFEIDFAQTRSEEYDSPGTPPRVSMATLSEDLHRRDFSCNALAVSLKREWDGQIVDTQRGVEDLTNKILRVLHDNSFLDDPMQLLRGFRLANRLGFTFDPDTAVLRDAALGAGVVESVSGYRRYDEFRKALAESGVDSLLSNLATTALISQLHPLLNVAVQAQLSSGESLESIVPEARFCFLCRRLSRTQRSALAKGLKLRTDEIERLESICAEKNR